MLTSLCYGSLNPDLVHQVAHLPKPGDDIQSLGWDVCYGGAGANTAVALAAWGVPTVVLGNTVGNDPLAEFLLNDLARRGVDVSAIEVAEQASTPHCLVFVTPDGERTIVASGYRSVEWQPVADDLWTGRTVAMVDSYSGAAGRLVIETAESRDVPVVALDVTGRRAAHATIVTWSGHEHEPDDAAALSRSGPIVILTGGAGPVRWYESGRVAFQVQPPQTEVVDPTGAGDTFSAMVAFGVGHGWEPERTVEMAVAASSLVVQAPRGQIPDLRATTRLADTLTAR